MKKKFFIGIGAIVLLALVFTPAITQRLVLLRDFHPSVLLAFRDTVRTAVGDSVAALSIDGFSLFINADNQIAQKVYADTAALKAASGDSLGSFVNLKQLSSSNIKGGGTFVYADSVTGDTSFSVLRFKSSTPGKHWVRQAWKDRNWASVEWGGAKGDNSNDDTEEIQSVIDAVYEAGGGTVYLMAKTTYKISKIYWPSRIDLVGARGSFNGRDYSVLSFSGTAGDTMLISCTNKRPDDDTSYRIKKQKIEGIAFTGGGSAAHNIVYYNRIDHGTVITNCSFGATTKDAIVFRAGSINFSADNFRVDNVAGYAFSVDSVTSFATFEDFTMDNGNSGADATGGFLIARFGDNDATGNFVFQNGQIEIHDSVSVDSALFYFEINPSYTDNLQYNLNFDFVYRTGSWGGADDFIKFSAGSRLISIVASYVKAGGGEVIANPGFWFNTTNDRFLNFTYAPFYSTAGAQQTKLAFTELQSNVRTKWLWLGDGADTLATGDGTTAFPAVRWTKPKTLLASPPAGSVEYDGGYMYLTDSLGTRDKLMRSDPDAISNISVGASPFSYANATSNLISVIVQGGTVSQVNLKRGATSYNTGATAGMFSLSPSDTLVVTHSSAPTMRLIKH